jgi:23S rRNA (cytosine1962-C5)-methyltransferase
MLTPTNWLDYILLDSGAGRKLEQFGLQRLVRPEPRAVWKPALPENEWAAAAAEFQPGAKGSGNWMFRQQIEPRWTMRYRDLQFWIELENSKQVGVFPENAVQWDWLKTGLSQGSATVAPRVLSLFGYTGLASLACAQSGAEVVHVDASRRAIHVGQQNQELSRMQDKPIRWLVDDALKFMQREVRRGNRYDGIVMDPPKYGLGPNKERWEFGKNFSALCETARKLLSDSPLFIVVTAYALNQPPEVLDEDMRKLVRGLGGELELGELGLQEKSAGRKISTSIYARWSSAK